MNAFNMGNMQSLLSGDGDIQTNLAIINQMATEDGNLSIDPARYSAMKRMMDTERSLKQGMNSPMARDSSSSFRTDTDSEEEE